MSLCLSEILSCFQNIVTNPTTIVLPERKEGRKERRKEGKKERRKEGRKEG